MSSTSSLADRAANLLGGRIGRRGFFARTAVVGTALAVNPLDYVLKPGTAYAQVCSCNGSSCACGSLCCDGYTEFCCTLTGANRCPSGTLLGGWWKVDGTQFCGGPRYYMDCNSTCGGCACGANELCAGSCSGTGCGCAQGSCDNRKAGCTMFRYGQCNQETCIGPIVCRLVSCVAPWSIDPSCTTTVRVDNATADHDRGCLHAVTGAVDRVDDVGHSVKVVGWALDFDTAEPVDIHIYVADQLAAQVRAEHARPDISAAYPGWGPWHGFEVTVPVPSGGPHQLCVYALNRGAGSVNTLLGCRQVDPRGVFGTVDEAIGGNTTLQVKGWAIDPDTTGPVDVHIYVDGQGAGTAVANVSRPDVGDLHPGFGPLHGYDVTVGGLAPGPHEVCVWGINVGAGNGNTLLGCRTAVVQGVGGFSDVGPSHPFATEIAWIAASGIASGFPDGTFRPGLAVTRQAMAAFLKRLYELVGGPPVSGGGGGFSDVAPGHPFYAEIEWLAASGITSGYDDGTFRPGEGVTRQAMAAFLERLYELVGGPPVSGSGGFSDVPPGHPFYAEIEWLAASGITSGFSDGTFRPGQVVTRQAMAAFLMRLDALVT